MSFLETIRHAKSFLEEQGRVSLRALRLEFSLDDDQLDALVEELVNTQQVAAHEGKALSWIGTAPTESVEPESETETTGGAAQTAEAERRQLTVLFCDLVDSTRLAAGLDPEDWRDVVRGYQEAAAEIIERFGGHVAQYLGDGLLVYFGYPHAHEDDAERAVHAALGIVDKIATGNEALAAKHALAVRIGIHTGPVVVGEMGGGANRETLAVGDTTNRAARLEGIAAPNTVVISAETLRLVRGIFATEDLGPQRLKGLAGPVDAHRVLQPSGVRSRLDLARGRHTPFVGREQEFGLLVDRWEQVLEGQGQTVLITGDAGLGKSRLALRFRESLGDQPHSWLESRTSPHGMASPLQPTIELVRQGLLIAEDDAPEVKLRKIEGSMDRARLGEEAVMLLAALLDVPVSDAHPPLRISADLQREKTLDLLVSWLLALGDLQPLLLLNEDLHWADPTSIELLGRIIDQVPTAKVLLVLTARPEFEAPWNRPKNLTPIALGRLRFRQATEMVHTLSDRSLPAETVEQIVERSDGVPLYLEEVTNYLIEVGSADLTSVPETLQGSLTARLDRLATAREVAQVASLLGREFSYRLLAAAAPIEEAALQAGLDRLVEASVLFQRGSTPDATFTFKHALIQDTAAASLLKSRRRKLHERVAHLLEDQFPAFVAERPEEAARHFEAAGLLNPAIVHYQSAGKRATRTSANAEAIAHLRRALDLLAKLPHGADRDHREVLLQVDLSAPTAGATGYGSPELERIYGRALELSRQEEASLEVVAAINGLSQVSMNRGELDVADDLGRRLLSLADQQPDAALLGEYRLGCNNFYRGSFPEALGRFEKVCELHRPPDLAWAETYTTHQGSASIVMEALTLVPLGYADRSRERCQEAISEAESLGHPLTLAFVLGWSAVVHWFLRELEGCRARADEVLRVSTEMGFPLFFAFGKTILGWCHAWGSRDPGGLDEIREGAANAMKIGSGGLGTPLVLYPLAEAHVALGHKDEALDAAEGGLAHSREKGNHMLDAELHRVRGEALLLPDRTDQAETEFLRSIDVAASQEARLFGLRSSIVLARFWQREDKKAEARNLLAPAFGWFTEGFDTHDLKDAKALLEELE